jgi:hypothetical protein
MDFAWFMLMLLIEVKCHTNFDTYIKTIGWLRASKGYTLKKGVWTWHLTGFSGVRESFLVDFNGTLDSTFLLTTNNGPPVKKLLKIP